VTAHQAKIGLTAALLTSKLLQGYAAAAAGNVSLKVTEVIGDVVNWLPAKSDYRYPPTQFSPVVRPKTDDGRLMTVPSLAAPLAQR
jgi:hypothetical protein